MEKLEKIKKAIKEKRKILVMFSGGIDSTFLAKLVYDTLGKNSIAVTIDSPAISRNEIKETERLAKIIGIPHEIIEINELKNRHLTENPPNRCYICRKFRDSIVKKWAEEKDFKVIADGLNYSDLKDYRPGIKASTEDRIWHPFIEFQVTKEEIRKYSKLVGLPIWNKPSTPCLYTRFPYGFDLTLEKVRKVEKAEDSLKALGFREVRIRYFPYELALVEVDDIKKALEERDMILKQLRNLGFLFISLDLEGFKSGKMNRILLNKEMKKIFFKEKDFLS